MKVLQKAVLSGILLGLCSAIQAGDNAARTVTLNIDAPTMAKALIQFTQQSGLQLIFPTDGGVAQLPAPSFAGTFTPEAALDRLLSNSGLEYEYINAHTIAVRPKSGEAQGVKPAGADAAGLSIPPAQLQLAQSDMPSPSEGEGRGEDAKDSDEKKGAIPEILVKGSR